MNRALVGRTLFLVGFAGLLASAGCTNSDPLNPAAGEVRVVVEIVNSPTRFDEAFFKIQQIEVEPLDPQAQGAAGENPIGLLNPRNTYELNGNDEGVQFEIPSSLGTGQWRMKTLVLGAFTYRDFDPPASTATCEEFITSYVPDPNAAAPINDFGRDIVFDVLPNVANTITLRFDHQAFVTSYKKSFICVPRFSSGCRDPWCLFIPGVSPPVFNPSALLFEADDYLEIE